MDYLARREHGSEELARKLQRRFGKEPGATDTIAAQLDRLIEEGLLSDERFAASLVRQLINRGLGPRRLDQELRLKGVRRSWQACADSEELAVDWYSRAEEVYRKKYGDLPWPSGADRQAQQKERARRARFLSYRGFDPDHFMHLLHLDNEHE